MASKIQARTFGNAIRVTHQHGEFLLTEAEALELVAEVSAELIERHDPDVPVARALGDLLEAMSEALSRRTTV